MSARRTLLHLAAKTAMVFAAIFVVTVLLVAMPGHRAPGAQSPAAQAAATPQSKAMPGMDMGDEKVSEKAAVQDMTPGHNDAHSHHMYMTSMRAQTPEDVQRANEIVTQLRAGIEKYKDYHVALDDGFKIFLPNLPQPHYHFTNYKYALAAKFSFDPAKPTSLLYKKVNGEYQLEGAMYTAPKRLTEDQLNERIPLSIGHWHEHVNLCLPPKGVGIGQADLTQFGLRGAIATQDACDAAGGRWMPIVFNWMVHVYPYETDPAKIWAH